VKNYFEAVTLGAFTWKNEAHLARLFALLRAMRGGWLAFHFLALSVCLHFPVLYALSTLTPGELLARLGGEAPAAQAADGFDRYWLDSGYVPQFLAPLLGLSFALVLVIQAAFYLSGAFFLGLSRMDSDPLPFRERLALLLFTSTLPCLAAAVFGLFFPAVHIIACYLAVILLTFPRSRLAPAPAGRPRRAGFCP
jgi:hypothetical protein